MTYLLFFGAGASRPFQIPTMQEMVIEFENNLNDGSKEKELYSKIKKIQETAYGYSKVDIESVFSVIQGISSEIKPKDMGHLAYYFIISNNVKSEFTYEEAQTAKKLKSILEEFIKEKCKSPLKNSEMNKIYNQSYHALLDALPGNKQGFSSDVSYNNEWKAYTTNYDNVFEDFCADFLKLLDYFSPEGTSKHEVFDTNRQVYGNNLTYVKLHGSLDWLKEKSGKIMKISSGGFTRYEIEGEAMLFPIQQKDLYLHHWITLFLDLKYGLRSKDNWIVIGYAFNDEFIFEIFKEALMVHNKRLIIINPSANELKSKFTKELRNQIIALPIKFGEKSFQPYMTDFFQNIKTLQLKIKTISPYWGFRSSLPLANIAFINTNFTQHFKKNQTITTFDHGIAYEHGNDVMMEFEVKFYYDYLLSPDLEIQFAAKGENDVTISVYNNENYVTSITSRTKLDANTTTYVSDSIKIYHSSLFLG